MFQKKTSNNNNNWKDGRKERKKGEWEGGREGEDILDTHFITQANVETHSGTIRTTV